MYQEICSEFKAVVSRGIINSPFEKQFEYANFLMKKVYGVKIEGSYSFSEIDKLIKKLEVIYKSKRAS